ncbi:MAG: peptidylprolyl isomerase [Sulfurovum sp.]|nr:peptidylprolyl isomerase [Sulfurovum sp.]MCB4746647.1 peptidylprolyl isomerase [Sulfurovum sp.]MCB4748697.1 peptidylprolyl isomerase [Sulfurovum sp.]MCB4752456.1 peptidylprolyl isomerase [Sulfurovum sp.]MCB4758855.1 peptidylprolyl isomerase [Sulfurovum sp.]
MRRKFLKTVLILAASMGLLCASETKVQIVVLETNVGKIELKMFPKVAPLAVENFVTHIKNGYYNGIIFHRVIKGFMIQGGDPTGTGRGGESIWHKEFKNEYVPNLVFDRPFLLAMANHGPNTNGSQFFITTVPTPYLNGGYTIFGEVVKGKKTVKKIENVTTSATDRPLFDIKIKKAYLKK